jgi:hypothetical protein
LSTVHNIEVEQKKKPFINKREDDERYIRSKLTSFFHDFKCYIASTNAPPTMPLDRNSLIAGWYNKYSMANKNHTSYDHHNMKDSRVIE